MPNQIGHKSLVFDGTTLWYKNGIGMTQYPVVACSYPNWEAVPKRERKQLLEIVNRRYNSPAPTRTGFAPVWPQ